MTRTLPWGCLCSLLLLACGQTPDNQAAKGSEYVLAGESSLTPDQQKHIVAKIGDRLITLQEFESRLNQQSVVARNRHNSPERKKEFLDSMVRQELLAIEAKRKGYDKDPDVILAQKQAMVKRFTSRELSRMVTMAEVTEKSIAKYYADHPAEFNRAAQVRASHILFKNEAAAKNILVKIIAEIGKNKPRARQIFSRFAETENKDPRTKQLRGDLQFFGEPGVSSVKRAQNAPPVSSAVANAAYTLKKVGDVFPTLVKSPDGWHIIQKTGYRRALVRSLDEMKNKLRTKLFRRFRKERMEKYIKDLWNGAEITFFDDVIKEAQAKRPKGAMPHLGPPKLRSKSQGGRK
jgi:peptidyl-prolyl cis-trans isomerase C